MVLENRGKEKIFPNENFEKSKDSKEYLVLEENEERRLSLSQLTERSCRWPVGDPLSDDFYFCGADIGEYGPGPYCRIHSKVAFQAINERRRVRI